MSVQQKMDMIATFDWTRFESPSIAVVTAVADESGTDPVTIEPLYETVDPDSLDDILATTTSTHETPKSVKFEYHDYKVTVNANGRGYIYE